MIFGTHLLLYSRDAEADRAFFRDVLRFPQVDAGEGWLIFAMPPAEIGVHPAGHNQAESLAGQDLASATVYLMCDKLDATLEDLDVMGVEHTAIAQAGWGMTTSIRLPGGAHLGLYEPRHPVAVRTSS